MANMKFVETTFDRLASIPIKNGQHIFCTDTEETYYDTTNNTRVKNDNIIKIYSEYDRKALSNPIDGKLYLVLDSVRLYLYYNDWIEISTQSKYPETRSLLKTITVSSDVSQVAIGTSFNNSTDTMMVFINSVLLDDYRVSTDNYYIINNNGLWYGKDEPITFTFMIFKNIRPM